MIDGHLPSIRCAQPRHCAAVAAIWFSSGPRSRSCSLSSRAGELNGSRGKRIDHGNKAGIMMDYDGLCWIMMDCDLWWIIYGANILIYLHEFHQAVANRRFLQWWDAPWTATFWGPGWSGILGMKQHNFSVTTMDHPRRLFTWCFIPRILSGLAPVGCVDLPYPHPSQKSGVNPQKRFVGWTSKEHELGWGYLFLCKKNSAQKNEWNYQGCTRDVLTPVIQQKTSVEVGHKSEVEAWHWHDWHPRLEKNGCWPYHPQHITYPCGTLVTNGEALRNGRGWITKVQPATESMNSARHGLKKNG